MIRRLPLLALTAALASACVTLPKVNEDGSSEVRLGQKANLGGPVVTVMKVLEDSRCPMEARCAWAGRVRLRVRIQLGSGTRLSELASDQPLPVADGTLELLGTMPPRSTQRTIAPGDYRFALKFSGGL
ncbi:MAG: hypothetical protein ABL914_05100 [Novosphingobium sp.]|uniref:hypothetical protein n=1 Tax=Novosphingobium sp. TaxID=1874826 RepID=UPI0032B8A008